jgi:hypothetical protein
MQSIAEEAMKQQLRFTDFDYHDGALIDQLRIFNADSLPAEEMEKEQEAIREDQIWREVVERRLTEESRTTRITLRGFMNREIFPNGMLELIGEEWFAETIAENLIETTARVYVQDHPEAVSEILRHQDEVFQGADIPQCNNSTSAAADTLAYYLLSTVDALTSALLGKKPS